MRVVRKGLCAFLREDGYCPVHRKQCLFSHDYAPCPDAVRRVVHAPGIRRNMVVAGRSAGNCKHRKPRRRKFRIQNGAPGWIVYKTCKRKGRYTNDNEARKAAKRMEMRYGRKLRAYYCEFCDGWHLTKQLSAEEETWKT